MIIDNIDPKTVRGSVGLMLRKERLARGLSFEQAADSARVSHPLYAPAGRRQEDIILYSSGDCLNSTANRSTLSSLTANNKESPV